MVKRIAVVGGILLAGLLALSACGKKSSPVSPRTGEGSARLSIPVGAIKAQVKAQSIVTYGSTLQLKYRIVPPGGAAPLDGGMDLDLSRNDNPFLSVSLPGAGKYLVSVEVFDTYASGPSTLYAKAGRPQRPASLRLSQATVDGMTQGNPLLLGAVELEVQGEAAVTMALGRLDSQCYNSYIYNYEGTNGYDFDQAMMTNDTQGDLTMNASGQLVNPRDGSAFITYLGHGDLVQFPRIASDARSYTNSMDAKGAPVSVGDVFGIRVPSRPGALVWLQVTNVYYNGDQPAEIDFCFRYNDEGVDYYRFDMTSVGARDCNDSFTPEPVPACGGQYTVYPGGSYIAADASGNLYLPMYNNLTRYDADGTTTTVASFGTSFVGVAVSKETAPRVYVLDSQGYYGGTVFVLDAAGVSLGSFSTLAYTPPVDLAVDASGNVFVADGYGSITKYTNNAYVTQWDGTAGSGGSLAGLGVDDSGNVYVADNYNYVVHKFSGEGAFVGNIGGSGTFWGYAPTDVALDASGNLYVVSTGYVFKLRSDGQILGYWSDCGGNNLLGAHSVALGGNRLLVTDSYYGWVDVFFP